MLLQQLVQHLGLLRVVEIAGHEPLPHGSIRGHRGLGLHVQVPLQDRVVRWGWRGRRGAWEVGRRWRRVLQAGGHSHVAQGLRGYGAQEMGVCGRDGGVGIRDLHHSGSRAQGFPPSPETSPGGGCPSTNPTWEEGWAA